MVSDKWQHEQWPDISLVGGLGPVFLTPPFAYLYVTLGLLYNESSLVEGCVSIPFLSLKAAFFTALVLMSFPTMTWAEDPTADPVARPADIVDLHEVDPTILVDMMYATRANFVGERIDGYGANICFLTSAAADGLKKAQSRLKAFSKKTGQELTLLVRDCYRPQKAVKQFVEWVKDERATEMKETFYPEISKERLIQENYISPVSGHSRASSVDLTIARKDEFGEVEPVAMGTIVDYFGARSHTAFKGLTREEIANRKLLLTILSPEFKNYPKEWWHFALKTEPYPKTFFDFDVKAQVERKPQSVQANEVVTQITQPSVLAELDRNNGSPLALVNLFKRLHEANQLPVPPIVVAERSRASDLVAFKETYFRFASLVKADIARIISELGIDWEKDIQKTYDPASAKTAVGKEHRRNGNVTRIFNEKWLTSSMGQFILAGVVNRMDRRDFSTGTCGEVRFIYRLGYVTKLKAETYASRMPFTINMVFNYKDDGDGCAEVASRWRLQMIKDEVPADVAKRVLEGPVDFSKLTFKQMEMNAQVARFPSDLENVEKRNFAGQAVYLMRIFGIKDGGFVTRKLENTPDVSGILKSLEKQKLLKDFISENISAIDNGAYLMPEALLADVVLSYSTLGSSRVANKPFDLLLKPAEADQLVTSATSPEPLRFIANGRGLLERLNTSTCMGCHQSSSTAGFHFLGTDRSDFGAAPQDIKTALDGNRLVLPFSPHLFAELNRRAKYVSDLSNRVKPNAYRPHPSAPIATWTESDHMFLGAGENMPCPLENDRGLSTSSRWSCDEARGLRCGAVVENSSQSAGLGQCLPKKERIFAGLSCRRNVLRDSTPALAESGNSTLAYNSRSFTDRITSDEQLYGLYEGKVDLSQYNCRPTKIGVPLGRVTKACTISQMSLKNLKLEPVPDELCAVVGGKGFEEMAKGYFNSKKFAEGVGRGLLNSCSPTRFCREDYICQEMPDFLAGSRFNVSSDIIKTFRQKMVGFCTPTYFVYQLRLDGHPNPVD